MSRLSIIVASSGRDSLGTTLASAQHQLAESDEILVSVNNDCPWGHKARNQLMIAARGDHVMFMDDDDVYSPGALDAVRKGIEGERAVNVFKMRYPGGLELWQDQEVRMGNVSTQMVVVPTQIARGCMWGDRYEGDFDFIEGCSKRIPVRWHDEVIALVRPG